MSRRRKYLAQIGIAAKGLVYTLTGLLTALTTIGVGRKTNSSGVLVFLENQIYGKILLVVIGAGLAALVFWRMYVALIDPKDRGQGSKALVIRVGYFIGAAIYAGLAYSALELAFSSGQVSSNSLEKVVASLLQRSLGQILVGVLATVLLGKGIYEVYIGVSRKFEKRIKLNKLSSSSKKLILLAGSIGHTSRGLIFGVIAFLTYKAAFEANSNEAGGTKEAFEFLQHSFGVLVFVLIALGLMAYGIFQMIMARHLDVEV